MPKKVGITGARPREAMGPQARERFQEVQVWLARGFTCTEADLSLQEEVLGRALQRS